MKTINSNHFFKKILEAPLSEIFCIFLILNPIWVFGNTLILKDGKKIENVRTSLREDHVLVEDETGKVEKIDLTLVEKVLISEIKEKKKEHNNIRKFYFSWNFSSWNSKVTEKMNFNRKYDITDLTTGVIYIDPYLEKRYTVNIQTTSFNGEYRYNLNLSFLLGLELSSYSFSDRKISPLIGILTSANLNSTPEYQALSSISLTMFLLEGNFNFNKHSKFSVETLSLLPGVKYYFPLSESILWFTQVGLGIGKSTESGIHSKVQTVLFAGTGIQWELESYFFNIALQYRKTDLIGATQSYHFSEPIFMIGGGLKL
ncbi:hypothetical protein LEP1GSC043_0455 [Leptospira weilii str. Ecochallenge]|uniref:Outer membrane protein beta-barrel domain protein n=2 Tax=Leptospira weilii TaxID=28184 RepID=N1UJY1_9LEPT|nr:hypothetical protein [Leptospira weilii]EMN91448.1 hypothetical protein LEP1GSC108_0953 [Leptospira weilii str. UI 13098]EMY16345.1 hypothetical protein LEP1GSC043_0455 [Leptospira weilii str. Ecochallenge]OMI15937.1 hypothetical protein BUQ74_18175 [Leptospira weilii serovar Heyan]